MPVIASAASAGIQAGAGIWQIYKGNQISKNNQRPTYEIPSAVKEKMTTAEMLQYQGLPETQKQEYIDNLSRNMAFSFNQLDSRKAGLAGVATIGQQGNDAAKSLLTADSQARMDNINTLQQDRSEYAGYQDKAFTFNKANPYYEKANQAEALKGAGMQNVMGAVNIGATALGNSGKIGGSSASPGTSVNESSSYA